MQCLYQQHLEFCECHVERVCKEKREQSRDTKMVKEMSITHFSSLNFVLTRPKDLYLKPLWSIQLKG